MYLWAHEKADWPALLIHVVRVQVYEHLLYAQIMNSTNNGRKRRTAWSKVYTDEPVAGDKYEEFWVPKDGSTPPANFEPWIESFAFEDVIPLPILPTLNKTGWAIPKRVFDAYCVRYQDSSTTVDDHLTFLSNQQADDDTERIKRHAAATRDTASTTTEEQDTGMTHEPKHNPTGIRRSTRLASGSAAALTANRDSRPPQTELDYVMTIAFTNLIANGKSRAGACDGGLDPAMLEFTLN